MSAHDNNENGGYELNRRKVLSLGVGSAATIAKLSALAGSAGAWEPPLGADFRGCSEVWIILGIIGYSLSRNPICSDFIDNDHRCTKTPNTGSLEDADCYPDCNSS